MYTIDNSRKEGMPGDTCYNIDGKLCWLNEKEAIKAELNRLKAERARLETELKNY